MDQNYEAYCDEMNDRVDNAYVSGRVAAANGVAIWDSPFFDKAGEVADEHRSEHEAWKEGHRSG